MAYPFRGSDLMNSRMLPAGLACMILASPVARAELPSLDITDCIKPLPAGYSQPLFSGLGNLHKAIALRGPNAELAQAYFDQGLTLLWAFNHAEAIHSFAQAAQYDPEAPMPLWGIGMAAGPDINTSGTDACLSLAYAATQSAMEKAKRRAGSANGQSGGAERELAYATALSSRYKQDGSGRSRAQNKAYAEAMKQLAGRFPDDLDAATLYAASELNLDAWKWWIDGKPTPEISRAIDALERIIDRDPNHLGANHYMIHALEESPRPEQALPNAQRLAALAPAAGHIVHMPSHIYRRTGQHAAASAANSAAVAADRLYIRQTHATARYPLHYMAHNIHFLTVSLAMEGRESESLAAAQELFEHALQFSDDDYNRIHDQTLVHVKNDFFFAVPILAATRFRNWDHQLMFRIEEALGQDLTGQPLPYTRAIWAYADTLRYLDQGDIQLSGTVERLMRFWSQVAAAPPDLRHGHNEAADLFRLANLVLLAAALEALPEKDRAGFVEAVSQGGRSSATLKHDASIPGAGAKEAPNIRLLRRAVKIQDGLAYSEPPDWYYPVRESLGAALYRQGDYAGAETVFREDLKVNRGNGRSLFGLIESLRAQNKPVPDQLTAQFQEAWKNASAQPNLERM